MKLVYRGVTYEHPPTTLEISQGKIAGKWRGQNWRYHCPKKLQQNKPK